MSNLSQLERARFFAGKLLTAADLEQEQDYLLARFRRHNRFLHGWGVVAGLAVSTNGNTSITVESGLAIDCAGNELVLPEPAHVQLAGLSGKQFVTIAYCELPVAAQPTPSGGTEFSRVRETVIVELQNSNPNLGHRGRGPGTPGCGKQHLLCLATLSQQGSQWRAVSGQRTIRLFQSA